MTRLTKNKVESIKKAGRYPDGNGLYLRVMPSGSRQWVQRIVIQGRRRDLGLGGYPLMPLDEARALAAYNRRIARVYKGDPTASPMAPGPMGGPIAPGPMPSGPMGGAPTPAAVVTFEQAAKQVQQENLPHWKNDKHATSWLQTLQRHAFPKLGSLPVNQITGQDVLQVLRPIWSTRQETARRVRQRMRATFGWAIAHGYMASNPAGEQIDGALPKQRNGQKHLRALPHAEVGAALEVIAGSTAGKATKLALHMLVLTACRSGEVRGTRWSEIDFDKRLWTIPAERTKTSKPHRVPLSDAAVQVLAQAKALADSSGLVFPSQRGRELSTMTLTKLLRSTGLAERATVHGFRSSFRDWCAETGKDRAIAEAALSHVVGGVEGAYFRSDLFKQRRALMQGWADYLTSGGNPVGWDAGAGALLAAWASNQQDNQQAKRAS